ISLKGVLSVFLMKPCVAITSVSFSPVLSQKANNLLGEFGIVRNSVYDIHIGNFMSSGYPTIRFSKSFGAPNWLTLFTKYWKAD
ncbi:hypothetical protein D0T85_22255, partial [Bacteroides sp. 519]|nr:hypothetical protein [Bacteroides sp. 519]